MMLIIFLIPTLSCFILLTLWLLLSLKEICLLHVKLCQTQQMQLIIFLLSVWREIKMQLSRIDLNEVSGSKSIITVQDTKEPVQ